MSITLSYWLLSIHGDHQQNERTGTRPVRPLCVRGSSLGCGERNERKASEPIALFTVREAAKDVVSSAFLLLIGRNHASFGRPQSFSETIFFISVIYSHKSSRVMVSSTFCLNSKPEVLGVCPVFCSIHSVLLLFLLILSKWLNL